MMLHPFKVKVPNGLFYDQKSNTCTLSCILKAEAVLGVINAMHWETYYHFKKKTGGVINKKTQKAGLPASKKACRRNLMAYNDMLWFSISDLQKVFSPKRIDHALQYCPTTSIMSYGALCKRFLPLSSYCDKSVEAGSRTVLMSDTIKTVQYHMERFQPEMGERFIDESTLFGLLSRMRRYTVLPSPADFLKWLSKIIIPGIRMEVRLAVLRKVKGRQDNGNPCPAQVIRKSISGDENKTALTNMQTVPSPDKWDAFKQSALMTSDSIDNDMLRFPAFTDSVEIMTSANAENAPGAEMQRWGDTDNGRCVAVQNNLSAACFPVSTGTSLSALSLAEEGRAFSPAAWQSTATAAVALAGFSESNDNALADDVNLDTTNNRPVEDTALFYQGSDIGALSIDDSADKRENNPDGMYWVSRAMPTENAAGYIDWPSPLHRHLQGADVDLDMIMDVIADDTLNMKPLAQVRPPCHAYVQLSEAFQVDAGMEQRHSDELENAVDVLPGGSECGKLYLMRCLAPRDAFRLLVVPVDVADDNETLSQLYGEANFANEEVLTFWTINGLDFTFFLYDDLLKEISVAPICRKMDDAFFLCEDHDRLIEMINTIICDRQRVYLM